VAAPVAGARFTGVAAREEHACALRSDGTLACWESNGYGESEPPEDRFAAVAVGSVHGCGIRVDGTLACWGSYAGGQPLEAGVMAPAHGVDRGRPRSIG
jgi:hypothetical protein